MNIKKIELHTWQVESRSRPGIWYTVYYRNCGGHCTCRGFRFNRWCAHLDKVAELAEVEETQTGEERLLYEGN